MTHEQILETIDEKMLMELGELATEGKTLHEIAAYMHISFAELMLARLHSTDFDKFMEVLETKAAGKHLASARAGIRNPSAFSAAAYDRVMGALGFTPHVAHVNVNGPASDAEDGANKVGFDTEGFMKKHKANAIIDINPSEPDENTEAEQVDRGEDDWERDKKDWDDQDVEDMM